jgi:hypothetical protein
MSTGGVFTLLTNDGKQDRMLMATDLLRKRLEQVRNERTAKGMDPTPTLADIERTHVLFMHAHFKPFAALAYEYNKVRANSGSVSLGSDIQFSIPQFGDLFHDMCLHVKLTGGSVTLTDDEVTGTRYCEYPGERLLEKVSFEVNGNPLDEYTYDAYVMHRNFHVSKSKLTAWKRCVGQEVALETPSNATTDAGINAGYRPVMKYVRGAQTPVPQDTAQNDLEMFIPLLFWFNRDPRLSIPSVSIPFGQRFINVKLAAGADIFGLYTGAVGTTKNTVSAIIGDVTVTYPTVSTMELYINNIFVNPEVHDIFIQRIGFSLVRVHRRQVTTVNKASDELLMQALKWPIETLYFGFRPTTNLTDVAAAGGVAGTAGNLNGFSGGKFELWHRFHTSARAATNGGDDWGASGLDAAVETQTKQVTNITLTAHGIPIYNEFPAEFFNAYQPQHYGGYNVVAPEDPGLYMMNFCLYPGTYQPNGHINVSRAREFYLKYTSSVITSAATSSLVVYASALNFLLISDGSAVLRYTT